MNAQPISFGAELRRRRLAAGLSLGAFAKQVHYSKSHLSKVENEAKPPSPQLARQCDAVLSAGGALAAMVPVARAEAFGESGADFGEVWLMSMVEDGQIEFGAVSRRVLLAAGMAGLASWSVPAPQPARRLNKPVVPSFQGIFEHVRALGQSVSPAAVVPVLVGHTHALRLIASQSPPADRDRALVLAARFAEYTGWMAQEAGDDDRALWWTDRAVELAEAGGDTELRAYALVRRALVALYRNDSVATVALAERAQKIGSHPRVRGLAAQREGQGHALVGDYDRCLRALDRASALFDAAARDQDDSPVIGTSTVPDPVAMVTGWCLLDLGRSAEAAEVLRREVARIPQRADRARARYGTRLSLALANAGDIEGACETVTPMLEAVSTVDSATIRADLGNLARTLRRWHTHPQVRQVMPALADALHTGKAG
jgi:transcriptional regulator with XRE-family HTH domain